MRGPSLGVYLRREFAVRSPLVSWLVFERLGGGIAFLGARAGLSPSLITGISGAMGVTGALLLARAADVSDVLLAALVLLLSYTFDCTDGQLARSTGRASARGGWFDVCTDAVVVAFVTVSLTYALQNDGIHPLTALLIGGAYGASRTASLLTAALVIRGDGGLQLTGRRHALRSAFVALVDTPVVYVAFCSVWLRPNALIATACVLTALTAVQTVVSGLNHFHGTPRVEPTDSVGARA